MAEILRTINIPENNSEILVYRNGIAVVSPEETRLRTAWMEKAWRTARGRRMHHVFEWEALSEVDYHHALGLLSDADWLRANGIPMSTK